MGLATYSGIEILQDGMIARMRSLSVEPWSVNRTIDLLPYPGRLSKTEERSHCARGHRWRAKGRTRCLCLEGDEKPDTSYWLERESGVVSDSLVGNIREEYSAFSTFSWARVPDSLKAHAGDKLIVWAQVTGRTAVEKGEESLLAIPEGAQVLPWCAEMKSPKTDFTVLPKYPAQESMPGKPGRVAVGLLVNELGKVQEGRG